MILLIKIILAHLIGDFILQPASWVEKKEKFKIKSLSIYFHALIHTVLILLLLSDIKYWSLAISIGAIHLLIDLLKVYVQTDKNKPKWFFIDQLLHLTSIILLWYIWVEPGMAILNFWNAAEFWLYATALIFLTSVTGILMQVALSNWTTALEESKDKSLFNAGKYIGILERILVFIFVVSGHWEGIGFLVAAKSVFRFGDLKDSNDRKLTEYILIGTLLSFGIAIITGMIVISLKQTFQ